VANNRETLNPIDGLDEYLAEAKVDYEEGDATALLDAISYCFLHKVTAPEWVERAFFIAWKIRWQMCEVRTLDEAFNIKRPSNWRLQRARKNMRTFCIWQCVLECQKSQPGPVDTYLFERAADEWNKKNGDLKICASEAQAAYYRVKNIGSEKC